MELTHRDVEKWVAVVDNKIIAKGDSLSSVYSRAKRICPDREPILDVYMGRIAMVV